MIIGLGLDLCQIDRISKAIENQHFLERIFTSAEQKRILSAAGLRRSEIAAGIFAAKEAAAKALGTGFTGFGFASVEILPNTANKPECILHGKALERFQQIGGKKAFVSITHEADMAAAIVILEGGSLT